MSSSGKQEQHVAITGQAGAVHRLPLSLSLQITQEMKNCPHFIKCTNGCGKNTCKAGKKGSVDLSKNDGSTLVSLLDCGSCLHPENQELKALVDGMKS